MFVQHLDQVRAWPVYLDDYNLLEVVEARPESTQDNRIRTLIYRARPKIRPDLDVAIKVVPLEVTGKASPAAGEMRVHYFLSQIDTESARNADEPGPELSTIEENDRPLEHDKAAEAAILAGKSWNVVPLYDFAMRKTVIRQIPGSKVALSDMAPPQPESWSTFLTMKYFEKTVAAYADTLSPERQIAVLRDAMVQLCAVLHQLMAIRFTHSDLKLENVAYIPAGVTLYHRLAPNKVVVLADQTGYFAMFDFGFATMKGDVDAGQRAVQYRFAATRHHSTQCPSFAPVLDLYRITESICGALSWTATRHSAPVVATGAAVRDLKAMMTVVLDNVTPQFKALRFHEALVNFVRALDTDSAAIHAAARALRAEWKANPNAWAVLHTTLPPSEAEIVQLALPWDVLATLSGSPLLRDTPPATGTEMTMRPVIGPAGRRYTGAQFTSDAQFRVAPLDN